MSRRRKTGGEVREEAYRLAVNASRERKLCGDPEAAVAILDLAKEILLITTLVVEKPA